MNERRIASGRNDPGRCPVCLGDLDRRGVCRECGRSYDPPTPFPVPALRRIAFDRGPPWYENPVTFGVGILSLLPLRGLRLQRSPLHPRPLRPLAPRGRAADAADRHPLAAARGPLDPGPADRRTRRVLRRRLPRGDRVGRRFYLRYPVPSPAAIRSAAPLYDLCAGADRRVLGLPPALRLALAPRAVRRPSARSRELNPRHGHAQRRLSSRSPHPYNRPFTRIGGPPAGYIAIRIQTGNEPACTHGTT